MFVKLKKKITQIGNLSIEILLKAKMKLKRVDELQENFTKTRKIL